MYVTLCMQLYYVQFMCVIIRNLPYTVAALWGLCPTVYPLTMQVSLAMYTLL